MGSNECEEGTFWDTFFRSCRTCKQLCGNILLNECERYCPDEYKKKQQLATRLTTTQAPITPGPGDVHTDPPGVMTPHLALIVCLTLAGAGIVGLVLYIIHDKGLVRKLIRRIVTKPDGHVLELSGARSGGPDAELDMSSCDPGGGGPESGALLSPASLPSGTADPATGELIFPSNTARAKADVIPGAGATGRGVVTPPMQDGNLTYSSTSDSKYPQRLIVFDESLRATGDWGQQCNDDSGMSKAALVFPGASFYLAQTGGGGPRRARGSGRAVEQ